MILEIIREARKAVARKRYKRKMFAAALAFNNLHTHTGDGLWMCPECHKVHERYISGMEWLTGAHYPACCSSMEGHRGFDRNAAPYLAKVPKP